MHVCTIYEGLVANSVLRLERLRAVAAAEEDFDGG